jgi:glycosyltransferase involved in cell wall biosynthesis
VVARPFVSVLVDTYNHERFIEQAIVSVLQQDFPADEMEVLVVDDGSTDGTPGIVRKFAPRVRYLRKANGGQASAFNAGIPETRGEIITFLDGDDWWAKNKLQVVLAELANRPDVGTVGHGIIEADLDSGINRPICPQQQYQLQPTGCQQAVLFSQLRCFLGTSRVTIRKAVLNQLLPIPEELVVEADEFMFTLAVAIGGAVVLERPLTYYRLHAQNLFQFRKGDESKLRRKRNVMMCLVRSLPPRLAACGMRPEIVDALVTPVWVEAERLRLTLGEGKPWDTFRLERAANGLAYSKTSFAYRVFKAAVLLSTLLLPPRQFYRAKNWYAEHGLRRWRRILGEPEPAAPILAGEPEA